MYCSLKLWVLGMVAFSILITFVRFSFFLHCIIAMALKIKDDNRNNKAFEGAQSSKIKRDFFMLETQNPFFGCVFSYKENWNWIHIKWGYPHPLAGSEIRRANPGRDKW